MCIYTKVKTASEKRQSRTHLYFNINEKTLLVFGEGEHMENSKMYNWFLSGTFIEFDYHVK